MTTKPTFDRKYRCRVTNTRKAKPNQIVIRAKNGHLVPLRNGRPVPWPKDLQLILRFKTAKHFAKHMSALAEHQATKEAQSVPAGAE